MPEREDHQQRFAGSGVLGRRRMPPGLAPSQRVIRLAEWASVACLVAVTQSCANDIVQPEAQDTVYLSIVSGNLQMGVPGEQLPDPINVLVEDENHVPVSGVEVRFDIISGGGSLDRQSAATDASGSVGVRWTLGTRIYPILKVSVVDPRYRAENEYVHANTEIDLETRWRSGIAFPRLFGRPVAHDDRILESNNFLLFSDVCTDEMKISFSRMAEEVFHDVLRAYGFSNSEEIGISGSNAHSKATLFYNSHTDFPYGAFAFNTGYVMPDLDAPGFLQVSDRQLDNYGRTMKHETVHLFQFLIGLDNLPLLWPDVWFSEGLAVHLSDNIAIIDDQRTLAEWLAVDGNTNPVAIHEWSDLPIPESQAGRYYTAFGLAVRYLLHESGHGKTMDDVRQLYERMASSHNGFAEAFEVFMGMSLRHYEDSFFDLVHDFLGGP